MFITVNNIVNVLEMSMCHVLGRKWMTFRPHVTDAQLYLFSGEQRVDVFHRIEICSVQGVLAGENLQNRTQGKRRVPEQLAVTS